MAKNLTSQEDAVREWLLSALGQDNLAPDIAQRVISSYVALTALQQQRNSGGEKK